jgi:hypothetical protein
MKDERRGDSGTQRHGDVVAERCAQMIIAFTLHLRVPASPRLSSFFPFVVALRPWLPAAR